MVGTNGPKALGVVARWADWWNWDGPYDATFREPYERLKAYCEGIGRRVEEIVLTAGVAVSMPEDPSTFEATYEHSFYPGQTFHVLGPTPADVIRELEVLIGVGVSHFQVSFEDMATFERFLEEVVPSMRLRSQSTDQKPGHAPAARRMAEDVLGRSDAGLGSDRPRAEGGTLAIPGVVW